MRVSRLDVTRAAVHRLSAAIRSDFFLLLSFVDIFPNVGVMAVFHGAKGVTREQEY